MVSPKMPQPDLFKAAVALRKQGRAAEALDLIKGRIGSRILQVGYDWVTPGALGHHLGGGPDGPVNAIRALNAGLRDRLPAGAFFLDLEQVSGAMGRAAFYDARRYFWTKQ